MAVTLAFLIRLALVALFLPFSALDKLLDFRGAVRQVCGIGIGPVPGRVLVVTGLFIEVVMSLGVLTGVADRLAAVILATYCIATAILYKRFWATGDFRLRGTSHGRDLFWDFLKNIAVAAGFALIAFGPTAAGLDAFLADPLSSTHPYSTEALR